MNALNTTLTLAFTVGTNLPFDFNELTEREKPMSHEFVVKIQVV